MKRYAMLVLMCAVFVAGAIARAQSRTSNPQTAQDLDQGRQRLYEAAQALQGQPLYQRGGAGGRGAPLNQSTRMNGAGTAWWTNPAMIARLGLTEDQKARIERSFENHRPRLQSNTELLEKEEAQLARLLEAQPLDRNAVLGQIDRVIQARAEVERENSAMTLEMREHLTRDQWMRLQSPQSVRIGANVALNNLISQLLPISPPGSQGSVLLEVDISREGIVENVRVISGPPQLTGPALEAVKQWRYKPILLNGEPVAVVTTITVNFGSAGERGAAPVTPPPSGAGQRRGRGQ